MSMVPLKVSEYVDHVIKIEGGYADHKNDRGGKTRYGVTEAVARKHGYTGLMSELPFALARTILLKDYWFEPKFDQVYGINTRIGEELFDTGVNMGQGTASRMLQRALSIFNKQAKLYPNLKQDGNIGRVTLESLRAYLKARGNDGELVMLRALNSNQGERYMTICEKDETQEDFVFGWFLNRVVI